MGFLLLFFVECPLFAFFLEATSFPGLCKPPLILEDRLIVEILEALQAGDHHLSIVGNLFADGVVLQVQDSQIGHLGQYLWYDLFEADPVVRKV